MARLNAKQRTALPDSAFAIPDKRKYIISTRDHAISALARVSMYGTPEEQRRVRSAIRRRYPDLPSSKREAAKEK